ncbi:hypothetical protein J2T17_007394 [Paenibacillus mucilaginosus]|uniref:hypothetical protein n=1 Tax=Paenibacillus mucilaginosus TaxID=61624 RepID=UPI003D1D09C2
MYFMAREGMTGENELGCRNVPVSKFMAWFVHVLTGHGGGSAGGGAGEMPVMERSGLAAE